MKKEEIKEAMTTIFDSILVDAAADAKTDPLFDFIASKKEWLGDPEELDVMINHPYRNIIEQCVNQLYTVNDHMITLIYTNWSLFDNIVTELTKRLEGSGCSADRGRTIVKGFINYRLSGELPVWADNYGSPKKGTPHQWMELVEGIGKLYYGDPTQYLVAFRELIAAEYSDV